jgi:phosphoribosyl 1,2-cyclic phosphodiesterase
MKATFYGVRGSIATPGIDTVRYGGNTSCVHLELDDGSQLIFDAGTGIRTLGDRLAGSDSEITLLFSHHHWDHIQGLPFFRPIYQQGRKVRMLSAYLARGEALAVLDQMIDPHFPVTGESLRADISVLELDAQGRIRIGDAMIQACPTNHPGGGAAFRVNTASGSLAYVTDNELFPPGEAATPYAGWVDFLRDVDVLIHDAMYLESELDKVRGWGHSSIQQALRLACDCDARHLCLFHHDPSRTDDALDAVLADARQWVTEEGCECGVTIATEGETIEV